MPRKPTLAFPAARRLMIAVSRILIALPILAQGSAIGQDRAQQRPPDFVSPEVSAERAVTFRIHAPRAESVKLSSGDLAAAGVSSWDLAKDENGVWSLSTAAVPAGAYRYQFQVDDLAVIDPRNPATSQSNGNSWSLVEVPGSDAMDLRDVPHGSVSQVAYYSQSLGRFRRMHVYTPPGYERGEGNFPTFYLLHGASDSDASWHTVGRAGVIIDNLIAAGKARPMIVVMPAGHTGPFSFAGGGRSFERQIDEFGDDFAKDLRPQVEKNYRVIDDRQQRAIAGLSMGGAQALNVSFARLDDFAYVGVFSSGIFGIAGGRQGAPPNKQWEENHLAALDNADLKPGLRLLWFATGKEDFLLSTTQATVKMLEGHGFTVAYQETAGGHTWLNWRDYLGDFASQLFPAP